MKRLSILFIALVLGIATLGSGLPQTVRAQEPMAFQTVEVADGLYSVGNGFVYNAFLVTDEGVLVFDSVDANHAQQTMDAIRGVTDLPIQYLIYSHNHYDHESGGQIFKDAGATVLSHEEAAAWLETNPNPNVVMPDETWSGDTHTVTSGGRDVILHYFGMNHGRGMTVFEFPDVRAIFTVDLVVPHRVGFTYLPDFSPKEWERSLGEILALDFDTVLFAHNAASGTRQDVELQLQYLQDLRAAIFAELEAGTNFTDIPYVLELPQYADWDNYEDWLHMNVWRYLMEIYIGE